MVEALRTKEFRQKNRNDVTNIVEYASALFFGCQMVFRNQPVAITDELCIIVNGERRLLESFGEHLMIVIRFRYKLYFQGIIASIFINNGIHFLSKFGGKVKIGILK